MPEPRTSTRPFDVAHALAAFHTGGVSAAGVLDTIRAGVLLTPLSADQHLLLARAHGLTWLVAFTSPEALAVYARRRGEGARVWDYATVRGTRLLGPMLTAVRGSSGVAVDLGSRHPMLLPAEAITETGRNR